MPKRSWDDINVDILAGLDIRAEFAALGVDVTGHEPNQDGWIPCRAAGRDDRCPSACINIRTGRYKDSGGEGLSLSLWDFAVQFGHYPSWQEARKAYAAKAGVSLSKGRPPRSPTEHLKFLGWNTPLAAQWAAAHKPGVTPEAMQAAGARRAIYREQFFVFALPVFGPAGVNADPVGWCMFQTNGWPLPVFYRDNKEPDYRKMKFTAGSQTGLMGMQDLDRIAEMTDRAGKTLWKVAGPSDMMALWSIIPPDQRESHLVITNSSGENETPKPWMAKFFEGFRVFVVHDADRTGEEGAAKWCQFLTGSAREVRQVRLPFEITENHGKDLRDYLNGD